MKPHLIDLMHIETNVSKNILQIILGMPGKDSRTVQLNCEAYGVHRSAWWNPESENELPLAPWQLDVDSRVIFMERLANMVFPSKYGVGFEYSFGANWPRGLKSHDYHFLVPHKFPTAIRGLLTLFVRQAIYAIFDSFR
jgi:hypothetical protein